MVRKVLFLSIVLLVFMAFSTFSFAAGLDDWTNLPGFLVDGKAKPAELKVTDKGLQFVANGGYYTDDGNYTGIIYNEPVELDKLKVEFTIEKTASDATDTWIGLHLLSNKAYFSVGNPEQSQGIVTLIRPAVEDVWYETFKLSVLGFESLTGAGLGFPTESKYTVSFAKNTDGSYSPVVNGVTLDQKVTGLDKIFKSGKAYFAMGASTNNGKTTQFTINKLNGKSLAAAKASEPAATTTAASSEANPKTGDAGLAIYAVLAMAMAMAMVLISSKRHAFVKK
jgi:hypothetical protein